MAATIGLLTVDAFLKPPEARGDFYYEVRRRETVKVTRPNFGHLLI
jgi:hypothetical protein